MLFPPWNLFSDLNRGTLSTRRELLTLILLETTLGRSECTPESTLLVKTQAMFQEARNSQFRDGPSTARIQTFKYLLTVLSAKLILSRAPQRASHARLDRQVPLPK